MNANADEPPLLRLRGWHSSNGRPIGLDFEDMWVLPVLFVPASETEFGRLQLYYHTCPHTLFALTMHSFRLTSIPGPV